MNSDEIICSCLGTTVGMIKDAVDAGANTLEEVQNATSVGTVCGICLEDVRSLVAHFVDERNKQQ